MIINIYNASHLIAFTPDVASRDAWTMARAYVRAMAHNDGVTGLNDGWYRTSGRIGYQCGIFRATPRYKDGVR